MTKIKKLNENERALWQSIVDYGRDCIKRGDPEPFSEEIRDVPTPVKLTHKLYYQLAEEVVSANYLVPASEYIRVALARYLDLLRTGKKIKETNNFLSNEEIENLLEFVKNESLYRVDGRENFERIGRILWELKNYAW